MSNTHTPGPWQVVVDERPHKHGGKHIERRIFTTWEHPQLKACWPVVNMSIGVGEREGDRAISFVHLDEADARLIAAAPDLLEALQALLAVLERQLTSPLAADRLSPMGQARAAIAKAIGKSEPDADAAD